jgi:hypothetical protein
MSDLSLVVVIVALVSMILAPCLGENESDEEPALHAGEGIIPSAMSPTRHPHSRRVQAEISQ